MTEVVGVKNISPLAVKVISSVVVNIIGVRVLDIVRGVLSVLLIYSKALSIVFTPITF